MIAKTAINITIVGHGGANDTVEAEDIQSHGKSAALANQHRHMYCVTAAIETR